MAALIRNADGTSFGSVAIPECRLPTDVLIRVALAGVCRTDIYVAEGRIGSAGMPLILGHEFSGVVVATGAAVSGVKQGQRVAVMPVLHCGQCDDCSGGFSSRCQDRTMLGVDRDGAFAEFVVVPKSAVYSLPDQVSFLAGAYAEPVAASLAVLKAPITKQDRGFIYGENRIAELTRRILVAEGFQKPNIDTKIPTKNAFDYGIETSATEEALEAVLNAVRPGGVVILKSRSISRTPIDTRLAVEKEIQLIGAHYGDFAHGLELLDTGRLVLDDLFGDIHRLENYESVFEAEKLGETRKRFFRPGEFDP